jgi:hypothetical protein
MATNLFKQFSRLIPKAPLLIGTVSAQAGGEVLVELPDGRSIRARGSAANGTRVWVRDGLVEGPAPQLQVELIDI